MPLRLKDMRLLAAAAVLATVFHRIETIALAAPQDGPGVESRDLRMVLRADLNGVAQLIDKASGRDYAAALTSPPGLYRLSIGRKPHSAVKLSSSQASKHRHTKRDDGLELRFEHNGELPLVVTCRIAASPDRPGIGWRIHVANHSGKPLSAMEYPILACRRQLGESFQDDAIIHPTLEGVLLCKPQQRLTKGRSASQHYPGKASLQFMYFFDSAGGLYVGAHDTAGHSKSAVAAGIDNGLLLNWSHGFPSEYQPTTTLTYDVVLKAGGGSWQHGADMYRDWVENNASWAHDMLTERDVPTWLLKTNVFLNFSYHENSRYNTARSADAALKAYRDFFGLPIVACAFGWEKHGAWIGPDYFPPRGGDQYYVELSKRLGDRGDHTHVFTSGFRWGVKKPVKEIRDRSRPRVYTDWDGTSDFMKRGKPGAAINAEGKMVFQQPAWADNYILCVGSKVATNVLADCFTRIYDYGIAGIDLDQDLGAEVHECYSPEHGHPIGRGVWQHQAMRRFLAGVRADARARNPDSFIGVEEPCEAYIPWIDAVHGRAFTDTRWPATGPGAVSIPLYIYIYHEHQLNYAGWIDPGFSPFGDERYGIGRAFVFGMQLGVRVNSGVFRYEPGDKPTTQMVMLRDAAKIMSHCEPYLLLGRMLHDPTVIGSPLIVPPKVRGWGSRAALPVHWPVVQATAWRGPDGGVCYAVVNLSDSPQTVQLEASENGMVGPVCLTRIDADGSRVLHNNVQPPKRAKLELMAWQMCCVEQSSAAR